MAITNKNIRKELEEKALGLTGIYSLVGNDLFKLKVTGDGVEESDELSLYITQTKNGKIRLVKPNGLFPDEHLGVLYRENGGYNFTLRERDITLGMTLKRDFEREEEFDKKKYGLGEIIFISPKKFANVWNRPCPVEDDELPLLDFSSEDSK
ncbi:MAG: hypothetical protein II453_03695 [Alphaproteobacteria bacterium]|nr:hypothetical protein [Alphaproteobacteria bacterium]